LELTATARPDFVLLVTLAGTFFVLETVMAFGPVERPTTPVVPAVEVETPKGGATWSGLSATVIGSAGADS
jgi:hypothetical protein